MGGTPQPPATALLDLTFPGTVRQVADNVAQGITEKIDAIGPERVNAIVADNCATMKRALSDVRAK